MILSIIIPVYNSERILGTLVKKIKKTLENKKIKKFEVILVNDYSKDNSWSLIKKLSKLYNFIKGINLIKNYGQHNAIVAGLTYSRGKYLILMDDDLQHDPKYIPNILEQLLNKYDACYVRYLKRKHAFWKKFVSKLNHLTSSFLANKTTKIYTSSFKGFNKKIKNKIIGDKNKEVFLDWIILNNSTKVKSIDVLHKKRLIGKTNYNFKKLLILWSNMIIKIKTNNKFRKLLIFLIKIVIITIINKLINKKIFQEKFKILEKTF